MTWLSATFFQSATHIVTWTLVHSLWQGCLIALVLAGLLYTLRCNSARLRYALSCGALMLMLITSLVTGANVYRSMSEVNETPIFHGATGVESLEAASVQGPVGAVVTQEADEATTVASPLLVTLAKQVDLTRGIFLFWLTGVGLLSLYNVGGWFRIRNLSRHGIDDLPEDWRLRIVQLCFDLRIKTPIRAFQTARVKIPCVIGWLRPVILVPTSALSGLSVGQLELILIHELAHIRRHDIAIGYLQIVVETLLFFHPATWWISRQIRIERENCCDDLTVQVTGDQLAYARALTRMETLRRGSPSHLAAAADGASLLSRIRRMAGLPQKKGKDRKASAGLISMVTLLAFIGLGIMTIGGPSQHDALASADIGYTQNDDDLEGFWKAWLRKDSVELRIEFGSRNSQTVISFDSNDDDGIEGLRGLDGKFPEVFALERNAGTFYCVVPENKVGKSRRASGDCFFRENPRFVKEMDKLGYKVRSTRRLFELAIHDVSLDFIQGLNDAGFEGTSLRKLIELRVHGTDMDYIEKMGKLGYTSRDIDDIIEMRVHGIDPDYVDRMTDAGLKPADRDQLLEMKIHGVDPEYLEEMIEAGFEPDDYDDLLAMKIHGISSSYVREMTDAGFRPDDYDDLLTMKIHGISASYVRDMADIGYRPEDFEQLLEMKIHGISPRYVEGMINAGFKPKDHDRLIEMKIHGLSPSYVQKMTRAGFLPDDYEQLLEMKIHGISPDYIQEMVNAGVELEDYDKLLEMKIHGISPDYVEEMANAGVEIDDFDRLLEMKIHGISPHYIQEIADAGVEFDDFDKLLELKIHGLSASYIKEIDGAGYLPDDHDDLLAMKIHGIGKRYIRELKRAGLKDFDVKQLIDLKIYGVDKDYIEDLIDEGFKLDVDEIIERAEEESRRYNRRYRSSSRSRSSSRY
ncbi:MAG: hypothetical protein GY835_25660 [bacterium]|nr:hypothetical protein [bacterium]